MYALIFYMILKFLKLIIQVMLREHIWIYKKLFQLGQCLLLRPELLAAQNKLKTHSLLPQGYKVIYGRFKTNKVKVNHFGIKALKVVSIGRKSLNLVNALI